MFGCDLNGHMSIYSNRTAYDYWIYFANRRQSKNSNQIGICEIFDWIRQHCFEIRISIYQFIALSIAFTSMCAMIFILFRFVSIISFHLWVFVAWCWLIQTNHRYTVLFSAANDIYRRQSKRTAWRYSHKASTDPFYVVILYIYIFFSSFIVGSVVNNTDNAVTQTTRTS